MSTHFIQIAVSAVALPIRTPGGIFRGSFRRSLGTGLMYLVICEAALLGSGQLLRVGPFTAKMLLFTLSTLFVLVAFPCGDRIRTSTLFIVVSYFVAMDVACLVGLLHDGPLDRIGKDISPMLSLLLLPFFELTIRTRKHVVQAIQIIMVASGVMIAMYIAMTVTLWVGAVTYADLIGWLGAFEPSTGMGDFLFDLSTQRVVYKGAIYLGIALICFLFHPKSWAKLAALFTMLNLIAIGLRGFFLALFLTGLVYVFIGPIRTTRKIALLMAAVLIGAFLLQVLFLLAGDRDESNRVRIATANQVLDRTNGVTTIVGNGFGFGVPERPEHMESAPLEIFYKQGVIGLCWWAILLGALLSRFRSALLHGNAALAYPLFLSSVFVAIESCTNPFINNPIGMTFITLALACLSILSSDKSTGPATLVSHPRGDCNHGKSLLN